ncbi:MAG: hypothetical protein KIT84_16620 [Labilithrix sp.]|nr:hypothetical protein [Labilithrix sp.]MCW5812655.1 hypothetical protein [Labilithrix sp.]
MKTAGSLAAVLAMLLGCGSDGTTGTSPDASAPDAGDGRTDPFCRTRPRLSFCEDFDEGELPGRFESIEGSAAIVTRGPRDGAPSAPNVVTIAQTAEATDARLTFSSARGNKFNLFFLVAVAEGHGRLDLAGLDDGDYHLELGVEPDGKWYVEERIAGGAPRLVATELGPRRGEFTSVRFDVYVDGAGEGHIRFRSGSDTVFTSEPLSFGDARAELAPRWYVGARLRAGDPSRVAFDTVTLGED